jgi:hypothetical protein
MKSIIEEFQGVPPDVQPVLNQMIKSLNRLTVLDQERVLETLVARHVMRKAYPATGKIIDVLADMLENIVATVKASLDIATKVRTAMEENRARQS